MTNDPYAWIEKSLRTTHRANWYRSPQTIESLPGPLVQVEGRELIDFASNDYLGLAADDRPNQAAIALINSRLLEIKQSARPYFALKQI